MTTAVPGLTGFPSLSPDGDRVLYLGEDGLYVMPALGGQSRRVAQGRDGAVFWGAWSPDGSRITYTVGFDTLVVQSLDESGRTVVAVGRDIHSPAWSPDGKWIAYVEGNALFYVNGNTASSRIALVPASGGEPRPLTDSLSFNTSPVWVPGERALLYISDRDGGRDIYLLSLTRSGRPAGPSVRITTGLDPDRLSLSADGRRIAWSVFTQTSNVWAVPLRPGDSVPFSSGRQITTGVQNVEYSAVSPDGAWLYYDSNRGGNSDVWRLPLGGGLPQQLTTNPAGDFSPSVSPDGEEVAFHSLRNGANNRDVFTMPAAGGPAVQVSRRLGDDRLPQWSPDGNTLIWSDVFALEDGVLMARRSTGGGWGEPTAFRGRSAIWSRDGGRILAVDSLSMWSVDPTTGDRTPLPAQLDPSFLRGGLRLSEDGGAVIALFMDPLGVGSVRSVSLADGGEHTIAYSDDPLRLLVRYGFDVHDGVLYIPLVEPRLDIWVADVERP